MAERIGQNKEQYCWPSYNNGVPCTWLIHSDIFEALKLAMGEELHVIRNGMTVKIINTRAEMNTLANECIGGDYNRVISDRYSHPWWRAQAVLINKPSKCKEMFTRYFHRVLKEINDTKSL